MIGLKKGSKTYNPQMNANQSSDSNENGTVVGSAKKKSSSPARLLIALVVIVLLGATGFVLLNKPEEQQEPIPLSDSLADASHNLEESGNYKQAIEVYDSSVKITSGEQKADLLTTQATIAFRNGDNQEAMKYIEKAVDEYPTPENLTLAGSIARKNGDNSRALDYYKRALKAFEQKKIRDEPEEETIKKFINELENAQ